MQWVTTDAMGNKKTWYSEDEVQKYKSFLAEIRDLKLANGINDDVFKMINRFMEQCK